MLYTAAQVAERLGVPRRMLVKLAEGGHLVPANTPKSGAKKFFAKYDGAAVNAYIKAGRPGMPERRGNGRTKPADGAPAILRRIEERLTRVEAGIVRLLEMWE